MTLKTLLSVQSAGAEVLQMLGTGVSIQETTIALKSAVLDPPRIAELSAALNRLEQALAALANTELKVGS